MCHGPLAEGGVGPALAGSGLGAGQVIAVVEAGLGVMPAGIVRDRDAADVAAFVASISGAATGTGSFTGDAVSGVDVRLDTPTPAEWTP